MRCLLSLQDYRVAAEAVTAAERSLSVSELSEKGREDMLKVLQQHADACATALATACGVTTSADTNSACKDATANTPTLSRAANIDYPALSSAVGVERSYRFGTHVVAKQEIGVGDVLAVEDPVAAVLVPPCLPTHCYGCLKRFKVFYPCRRCTVALYCSEQCEKVSWSSYDSYECHNMAALTNCGNPCGHVALRATLTAGLTHYTEHVIPDDSSDAALRHDAHSCPRCPPAYARVLCLNYPDWDHTSMFWFSVMAVYLALCTSPAEAVALRPICKTGDPDELLCDIAAVTLHHLRVFSNKIHSVSELLYIDNVSNNSKSVRIASAMYPSMSLFNHSCDASVSRHYHGTKMVVRSMRPMFTGEQIFDDYGALYLLQTRQERKARLKELFHFDCTCEACLGYWPTHVELQARAEAMPLPTCVHPDAWMSRSSQCPNCRKRLSAISPEAMGYAMMVRTGTANSQKAIAVLTACLTELYSLATKPHILFAECQEALKHCYSRMGNSHQVLDLD